MRQRVVGAMAIAAPPRLLIADEPTTSLDLTIQAQYLGLLKELQARHRLAMIFVTHNLGIVARMCDRVAVMYAGRIVEIGPVRRIFTAPAIPTRRRCWTSIPRLGARRDRLTAIDGPAAGPGHAAGRAARSRRAARTPWTAAARRRRPRRPWRPGTPRAAGSTPPPEAVAGEAPLLEVERASPSTSAVRRGAARLDAAPGPRGGRDLVPHRDRRARWGWSASRAAARRRRRS